MLTVFDILAELAADRSTWFDVRHYPPTVTCRRMLRLADFAAADPARWSTCRMAFEVPELSREELAAARGVAVRTIQRHLEPIDLEDRGDFTPVRPGAVYFVSSTGKHFRKVQQSTPKQHVAVELDGERPEPFRAFSFRFDAEQAGITFRHAGALCTFAASEPARWRVIRLAYECPKLTQAELAERCGVCERTVRTYLEPVHVVENNDFPEEIL